MRRLLFFPGSLLLAFLALGARSATEIDAPQLRTGIELTDVGLRLAPTPGGMTVGLGGRC
jgi:hypothetical protein